MIHHHRLRDAVEIDEDVATENDIDTSHEQHLCVVTQIETVEGDEILDLRSHLQVLLVDGSKVFAFEKLRRHGESIVAKYAGFGSFKRAVIQVGGLDIKCPSSEQAIGFFEKSHGQRVRFFTRGAPCAPEANAFEYLPGFFLY